MAIEVIEADARTELLNRRGMAPARWCIATHAQPALAVCPRRDAKLTAERPGERLVTLKPGSLGDAQHRVVPGEEQRGAATQPEAKHILLWCFSRYVRKHAVHVKRRELHR